MPVIYRGPNVSIALGITNGSFGKIVSWILQRDTFGLTVPVVAIVQFDPDAKWCLSGLPPGCVPIYPTTSSFNFQPGSSSATVYTVKRLQLPLQPGFAMTVHSAQGITSSGGVVVDLTKGGFHTYVAASRATRREDIFLVREVALTDLNHPPLPQPLLDELDRFRRLAEATAAEHDHDRWRLSSSSLMSRPGTARGDGPPSKRCRTE
ncbi:hypothetical protein OC834_007557 [Tilletia horrida]|nr:hypothetical protein OC834_007557 [Tilletia horrida]